MFSLCASFEICFVLETGGRNQRIDFLLPSFFLLLFFVSFDDRLNLDLFKEWAVF